MSDIYIGIMTGTSLDAIDIALVSFDDSPTLLSSTSCKLPPKLKADLSRISQPNADIKSLIEIKSLEQDYTHCLIKAVETFINSEVVQPYSHAIKALGVHGVTICHEPNLATPFTWQIVDAHKLAATLNVNVVYDFRSKDIALGGQGAPLVPMFHYDVFKKYGDELTVLNLGGIGNVSTWLSDNHVIGFDTGPANTLLDFWIRKNESLEFDANGDWAKSGQCSKTLLKAFLEDPYFAIPYPKSTGKEAFSEAWLLNKLAEHEQAFGFVAANDIQNTLTHLTAKSVELALQQYRQSKVLAVCGGGVHNQFLMSLLSLYLPNTEVISTKQLGICPDNMEAIAFAWLAKCRLENKCSTLPSITGTSRSTVLGAWVTP